MNTEVAKEFAEMQRKMNNMQKQMDDLAQMLHKQSHDEIDTNAGAIMELAEIIGGGVDG